MTHITPLHILIAIHYVTRPCPYAEDKPNERYSVATVTYTNDLVRAGLLTLREPGYTDVNTAEYAPTTGCRMFVDALCSVEYPKMREAWVHPMLDPLIAVDS